MDCLEVVMVLIWPLAGGWEAVPLGSTFPCLSEPF